MFLTAIILAFSKISFNLKKNFKLLKRFKKIKNFMLIKFYKFIQENFSKFKTFFLNLYIFYKGGVFFIFFQKIFFKSKKFLEKK